MADDDIAEFLTARFDEDEAAAQDAADHGGPGVFERDNYGHLLVQTTRVLADVEAKRRIVELHQLDVTKVAATPFDPYTGEPTDPEFEVDCAVCGWASADPTSGCDTLRLLALPYVDHEDYREEWRP